MVNLDLTTHYILTVAYILRKFIYNRGSYKNNTACIVPPPNTLTKNRTPCDIVGALCSQVNQVRSRLIWLKYAEFKYVGVLISIFLS